MSKTSNSIQSSGKKKKSLFRRILKWTGITFLLVIIALILIPIFFKDQIKEFALKEANKMLLADVELDDFDLTILSTFPKMTAQFQGVRIKGRNEFKGKTLADIKNLKVHLDFWSVVGGDQIEVKGISVVEPTFDVKVLKNGSANYDIVKPDSLKTEDEIAEPSNFKLTLTNYSIEKANITYNDRASDMYAQLKNMNHEGTGDLTADVIDFETVTNMDELTYNMDGISYLSQVKTDLVANILMEFTEKTSKFTLRENTISMNALKFSVDGFYEMLENKDNMDLKLNASKASFKDFLSLIPTFYHSGYESMITKGSLALEGKVKGILDDKNLPAWNFGMKVDNASIRYPDLPKSINNIALRASSIFPGGINFDAMVIDVPTFHADFAGNVIDATLNIKNLESDPHLLSNIFAKVNLATLSQVVPMGEGESYNGKLDADISLNGKMSAIEQERYEDFNAMGTLKLMNMMYKSADLPEAVSIQNMVFRFSPENLALEQFDAKMGKSDFKITGKIDNYMGYIFGKEDDLLKGKFDFESSNLDLDQLMGLSTTSETSTETASTSESSEPVLIPDNIDFSLNTKISNLRYNKLDIKNVAGNVGLKEEVAYLNNLTMNTMGGTVGLKGSYNTQDHDKPTIDFGYELKQLDIQQLATNFVTIEKLAPIAKHAQGKITSKFDMNTRLKPNFEPIMSSLTGGGDLSTALVTISGFEPLKKLGSELKMDKLSNQTLKDVYAKFKFENGKVNLTPFNIKMGKINTNVSGSTSFEQEMDYKMILQIPKEELPASILQSIESGLQKINGITPKIQLGELPAIIPVNAFVRGVGKEAKVTTDLADQIKKLSGNMKNSIKDAGKDLINQGKDSVKTIITNKVEEVREDLNKKKQQILDEAQKQADRTKAEAKKAADAVRSEADKQAQKLINEAGSNPLKKKAAEVAGNKLKKEAEEKAGKIENEGNQKADGILNKARERADQVK
jgi:hypothetical protein